MDKNMIKLMKDTYHGVTSAFSQEQNPNDIIRNMLVEACGGSTTMNYRAIRDGKINFSVIEEVINVALEIGSDTNSRIWDWVEFKNGKLGDKPEFTVNDGTLLTVDVVAGGTQGIRRQRLASSSLTLTPVEKAVKIYEELSLILSGRIDWVVFVNRVARSFEADAFNEVAAALRGVATTGDFAKTGTFSETSMIELIEAVENATGQSAKIVGSLSALRMLNMSDSGMAGDKIKDDYYNMGYMGRFNGTPCFRLTGKKLDTPTAKILYVIAGDDKFIKIYDEGETLVIPRDASQNADLTQEYTVIRKRAVGVVTAGILGKYTIG